MCVTDLDLDHEITEDDQPPEPNPQPSGHQAPGVAWG